MTWRTISAASTSHSVVSGEKSAVMPTDWMPASRIFIAASRTASRSSGTSGRPSYSWPPSTMKVIGSTDSRRSSGQSTIGGSEAPAGMAMRIAATRSSRARSTTALVKWVVPIITASTGAAWAGWLAVTWRIASTTPFITSDVVGNLMAERTVSPSIRTASVLVPPTSMPIRFMMQIPI